MSPQKQTPTLSSGPLFSGWITVDSTAKDARLSGQLKCLNALIESRKNEFKTELPDSVEIRLHNYEPDPLKGSRLTDVDQADVRFHLGDIFANRKRHEDQLTRNQGEEIYPRNKMIETQLTPRKMPLIEIPFFDRLSLRLFGGESMADYLSRMKAEAVSKLEDLRFLRPVTNQNERYSTAAQLLSAQLHQAKIADVEEGLLEAKPPAFSIQPRGVVLLVKPEDIEQAKQVLLDFGCKEKKEQEQPNKRVQLYFDDIPISVLTLENFKTQGVCLIDPSDNGIPTHRYYLDEAKLAPLDAPISYLPMELKDHQTGQLIGQSYVSEARTRVEERQALLQMQEGMKIFKRLMPLGDDDDKWTN